MAEGPAWKKLVEELQGMGHESPYLDRLRERLGVVAGGGVGDLQREILQEMASALGRTEDKLNVALLELDVIDKRMEQRRRDGAPPRELAEWAERFNAQRDEAARRLRDLVIHREAMGFRRNEVLATLFPIPPRKPVAR